jgi:hypothetical protein
LFELQRKIISLILVNLELGMTLYLCAKAKLMDQRRALASAPEGYQQINLQRFALAVWQSGWFLRRIKKAQPGRQGRYF